MTMPSTEYKCIKVHTQIQLHFPYNCRIKSISILPKPFRGNNCLHQKNSKEINESIHLDQFLQLCNSCYCMVIKSKYWDFIRLVYPWLSVRTFTDICYLLIQSLRSTWNSFFFNLPYNTVFFIWLRISHTKSVWLEWFLLPYTNKTQKIQKKTHNNNIWTALERFRLISLPPVYIGDERAAWRG